MKLAERGFSLVEMAIVVVVMGLVLAFSVPTMMNMSASQQLKGATENFAVQMRLAREKAIATSVQQPMRIVSTTQYQIVPASGIASTWTLPRGITIVSGTNVSYRMGADGHCDNSGLVVFRNARGLQDTVSIQVSGLVFAQ